MKLVAWIITLLLCVSVDAAETVDETHEYGEVFFSWVLHLTFVVSMIALCCIVPPPPAKPVVHWRKEDYYEPGMFCGYNLKPGFKEFDGRIFKDTGLSEGRNLRIRGKFIVADGTIYTDTGATRSMFFK